MRTEGKKSIFEIPVYQGTFEHNSISDLGANIPVILQLMVIYKASKENYLRLATSPFAFIQPTHKLILLFIGSFAIKSKAS